MKRFKQPNPMRLMRCLFTFFMILMLPASSLPATDAVGFPPDPCMIDEEYAAMMLEILGSGWGYNYDSLLTDLDEWGGSVYCRIDSMGVSVQKRTLWLLTITDSSSSHAPRYRITIHARTHPSEVQSTWVTNEMIERLLSGDELSRLLLRHCTFNIVPMYNPDGVELGYPRQNANYVDLERDWDKQIMQPESAALKALYGSYMDSELPIRVALNMHSSSACARFFVFHHENGTSEAFVEDEKHFISQIQAQWPSGFEDWDYFVSWSDGTPTHYPESWFWLNFGESVMALTYEDMNCPSAGSFDKTAGALLAGIADYLGLGATQTPDIAGIQLPVQSGLEIYPNPVTARQPVRIRLRLPVQSDVQIVLYDVLGRRIRLLLDQSMAAGIQERRLSLPDLASGVYFLQMRSVSGLRHLRMIIP